MVIFVNLSKDDIGLGARDIYYLEGNNCIDGDI